MIDEKSPKKVKPRKKCKYCDRTFTEEWALINHEKNCQRRKDE